MYPRLTLASDQSILVDFGPGVSPGRQQSVARLFHLLSSCGESAITNLHPAYHTLLIEYDLRRAAPREMLQRLRCRLDQLPSAPDAPQRCVELPVCYGGEFGPDLDFLAETVGMSPLEVIRLHSSVEYLVYFLGFSPGFPYLGELPECLALPRRRVPRTLVPAGSVAIGGRHTGIYPLASPGGWHLIGRTPLALFQPEDNPPTLLRMGDRLRFRPLSPQQFQAWGGND